MNLFNIFQEIETVDPEFHERISPRRAAIKNMTGFGKKLAVGALPFALSSLFTKAYGQTAPTDVNGVLNFALTLEYLEAEFYTLGVAAHGSQSGAAGLAIIKNDENNHVTVLKSVLGANAVAKPTFDFKILGDPFISGNAGSYDTFLALAQAFEDTGVRAYKGQAGNLMSNKAALQAALNIHSVEARHAAHIRMIRRGKGASQKPWITGNDRGGIPSAAQAVYNGEDFDNKAGTATLVGMTVDGVTLTSAAVTEAFDEPLSYNDTLNIAKLFIK